MSDQLFEGAMTALVTPMRAGKKSAAAEVDEDALRHLVSSQLDAGIDALVPCGTTGESATLTAEEHQRVIRIVVAEARGRVPVIAGAGANSTEHAIALSRAAKEAGADALLQVTPYYNRPSQEGLYQHFAAIVRAVPSPIILYNVPTRTGCDLQVETIARLCELSNIVAIKEASGSVQRTQQILALLGERLPVLCGEDAINYSLYALGARGCISVVSNVAPKLVASAWDRAAAGDFVSARALHFQMLPLAEALFSEPSPIPVKAALALMGKMSAEARLPLTPMSESGRGRLRATLAASGLIS